MTVARLEQKKLACSPVPLAISTTLHDDDDDAPPAADCCCFSRASFNTFKMKDCKRESVQGEKEEGEKGRESRGSRNGGVMCVK